MPWSVLTTRTLALVPGAALSTNAVGPANVPVSAAIVTAIKYRASDNSQEGFFLQSTAADDDGDSTTSEGLYVFSSVTANRPAVSIGDAR